MEPLLRVLRGLALESPTDRPIPSTMAWVFRITTFFLVVPLAAMAVLYGGLAQEGEEGLSVFKESFFALAHISYLCLVFWDLLLARPIYRIYRQTLIYPALLFIAYVLYATSAYIRVTYPSAREVGTWIKSLSYLFFIFLYLLWAARDVFEWRANFTQRAQKFFWLCGDSLALIVLSVGLRWTVLHGTTELTPPWYGNKDSAVLFTLCYWLVFSLVTLLVRDEAYHQIYSRYLDGVVEPSLVTLPSFDLSVVNLLDVGCGDGRRTCQLLGWLNPQPKYLKITGFDRDSSHREPYLRRLQEKGGRQCKVSFHTEIETINLSDYNLIILSHFIYEPSAVSLAINILKSCSASAHVIVRGSAPNSVFQAVSRAYSLRLLRPTSGHQWSEGNLQSLAREADLIPLNPPWGKISPVAKVSQSYDLRNGVGPLADLLSYLYGNTAGDECRDYFLSLQESAETGSILIPNDDTIFILKRADPLVAKILKNP